MLDWNREEAIFSSASVRPPDIGRLDFVAAAKLLADERTATNFALPRKMHTCIFKIRRKKFTLAAAFRKKVMENVRGAATAPLVADLVQHEREILEAALQESEGVVRGPTGAPIKLGVPRQTLESKIRKLGINPHLFKTS